MTSTAQLGESTVASQRDFLLQRLMRDSQRLRLGRQSPNTDNPSDVGQRRRKGAPSKASVEDLGELDEEKSESNSNFQRSNHQKMFSNGLQLINNPLHQYAATLAAAHFMQAAAGFPAGSQPSALPLLIDQYPILYRSLLPGAFPNGIFPHVASEPPKKPEPNKSASNTTEKRMASISLSSPKQNATPSPRKRAPPKKESNANSPAPGSGAGTPKKARAIRRIQFDDEMCSPVSGMYIKDLDDCSMVQSPSSQGDVDSQLLDDSARWVEITEEAKAELAKIPNLIGDYICRLCKVRYCDAFHLAKHRCPRIAHEEYRCPECDKVFSCPANLASHRRWHKPKDFVADQKIDQDQSNTPIDLSSRSEISPIEGKSIFERQAESNGKCENGNGVQDHSGDEGDDDEKSQTAQIIVSTPTYFECQTCGKRFDAHRWLRAHALAHTNFNRSEIEQNSDSNHESTSGDCSEVQCAESGCQMWFLSVDALEKHRRGAHPKFVCKFCSQSFPTSPALTRHINRQHPAPAGECRVILLPQSSPSHA